MDETGTLVRFISVLIAIASIAPCAIAPVLADGMSHKWGPTEQDPDLMREEAQYAIINFEDGFQKMILQISVNRSEFLSGERMLWVFPVPSPAEDVELGVISGTKFPDITGHFTRDLSQFAVYKSFFMTSVTQVYTLPFSAMFVLTDWGGRRAPPMLFGKGFGSFGLWNVTVHEHIEKFGLVSEVISAETSAAIGGYLEDRNITLPGNAMASIDDYIDRNYSFSVSWISNTTQFASSADPDHDIYDLGVSLSFPTDRIYFPLKMTSVYGDEVIPIVLQIIGTVGPAASQEIVENLDMMVDYAYDHYVNVSSELFDFFEEQITSPEMYKDNGMAEFALPYTLIIIEAPSSQFTDDIWFAEEDQLRVSYDGLMRDNWMAVSILLLIFISMLSSLIAGLLVFRGLKPSKMKFALLGLANMLSLIGLGLVSIKLKVNYSCIDRSTIDQNILKENAPVEPAPVRYYVLAFTMVFMALEAATYVPLFLLC